LAVIGSSAEGIGLRAGAVSLRAKEGLFLKVAIIGGGLSGVTTAWFLVQEGHEVVLVDRAPALASECSFANGGLLHAGHAAPWNSPHLMRTALRSIGRRDSPLALHLLRVPAMLGWGVGFLRCSRQRHYARSARAATRLAVYSLEVMRSLRAAAGIDYDHASAGILKIFRARTELDAALAVSRLVEDLGVPFEVLEGAEAASREPALADVASELAGAIYYPGDESGDPCLFARRHGEAAARQGAELRLGCGVLRIAGGPAGIDALITEQGRVQADCYVLAAGVDAPRLAAPLGLRLPIQPVKGYSATVALDADDGAPRIPVIDDSSKVVMTCLGGRLRIAGFAEFGARDARVCPRKVALIVDRALQTLPRLAAAVRRERDMSSWGCMRPVTVDGPPILGASPVPGLFLNVGGGHVGWTFAAGAGRFVADAICGREPAIEPEGLTFSRFRR